MPLKLNEDAFAHAQQLIQQHRVDREGDWASHQPTTESKNKYLASHTYKEYGNWFLGENSDANPNTKEQYEFPYGNFKKLFLSGIIAAEQRAGQYKHVEIEAATKRLLEMIG